jgi:tRNA-specific 2-thiouridylase
MAVSSTQKTKPKVLAAMSGGVDSSVATALLLEQGYEVIGSMLRFWPDDRPAGAFDLCCSPTAAFDARRVAEEIDVPFYLLDAREEFQQVVIDPFVPSYEGGKTPNPCVWCNRDIKFGSFVKRAVALGCDYVATGHYVKRIESKKGVELHRGDDDSKDQTYFLWALKRDILPYLLFPLAELDKAEVRQLAEERGFFTAHKASSHGLCFISSSVKNYLIEETEPKPGPIVDAADGNKVIGEHAGIQYYTIGQKKGLGLYHSHLQRFVTELRAEDNTVVVDSRENCHWSGLVAEQANFLLDLHDVPERVMAQCRYRQQAAPASLIRHSESRFELRFDAPMFAIAPGQSAVIYDGSRLLGGGVIIERH